LKYIGDWGLGIGDWGLGIGDWAQSPIPNPQLNTYNYNKLKSVKFLSLEIIKKYIYNFIIYLQNTP